MSESLEDTEVQVIHTPAEPEVLLEWTYSPHEFFESAIEIARSDYTIDITSGAISARLSASAFDADKSIRQRLHDSLFDRMRGIQLLTREPFQLSKPRLTRIEPDGRRHIFVELEGAVLTLSGGLVDITVTDASGKIVRDTKQERIQKGADLADLVAKYSGDVLLKSMLASYSASTTDANNELVHLYEIRDSLSAAFDGKAKVLATLNITTDGWGRLGQLCCHEPLRQGRHRGENFKSLRDATEPELSEAREIAREMIEAYLQFLEGGNKVT